MRVSFHVSFPTREFLLVCKSWVECYKLYNNAAMLTLTEPAFHPLTWLKQKYLSLMYEKYLLIMVVLPPLDWLTTGVWIQECVALTHADTETLVTRQCCSSSGDMARAGVIVLRGRRRRWCLNHGHGHLLGSSWPVHHGQWRSRERNYLSCHWWWSCVTTS